MSESSNEPELGLISDDQLPEDLNPAENPLARDPDDEDGEGGLNLAEQVEP